MIFIWALVLAAAAVSNTDAAATRIVGGSSTPIENYPSTVQVEFRNVFLWWSQECAGTILTPRHVLSVAHCFTGFLFIIEQRRIRAGSGIRDDYGITIGILRAFNHPTFENRNEGDITVLLLQSRLTFDATIQAASIPPQDFEMYDNAPVTIAGWGTIRAGGGGGSAYELQTVGVNIINHDTCRERYEQLSSRNVVSDTMICVGVNDDTNRDACEGDEGGPMYLSNDILLGIISWGHRCAEPYYPRVGTKVSAFSNWIVGTVMSE